MANVLVNQQVIIDEVNAKLLTEPKTNLFAETTFVEGTPGDYNVTINKALAPAQKLQPGELPTKQDYVQESVDVPLDEFVAHVGYTSKQLIQHGDTLDDKIKDAVSSSISDGIDVDRIAMVYTLGSSVSTTATAVNRAAIISAKGLLGEFANDGERLMLWAHPTDAINMENDPDFKMVDNSAGTIGFASRIYGADIVSYKGVTLGKPFLVKPNAIGTYVRKDGTLKSAENIIARTTDIVGTKNIGQIVLDAEKFAVIELNVPEVV